MRDQTPAEGQAEDTEEARPENGSIGVTRQADADALGPVDSGDNLKISPRWHRGGGHRYPRPPSLPVEVQPEVHLKVGTATSARQWTARHGQQSGKPALSGTMRPDRARSRPRSSDRTASGTDRRVVPQQHRLHALALQHGPKQGRKRSWPWRGTSAPPRRLQLDYARSETGQTSHPTCRWAVNFAVAPRSATMPPGGIAPPLFSPTRRPCLARAGRTSGMNIQAPTSAETLPVAGGLFPSPCAWKRSGRRPIGAPCGRHNEHRALLYALLPGRRRGRRSEPPSFAPQPHGRRVRRLSQHAQRPGGLLPLHAQFGVRRSDHPGRR